MQKPAFANFATAMHCHQLCSDQDCLSCAKHCSSVGGGSAHHVSMLCYAHEHPAVSSRCQVYSSPRRCALACPITTTTASPRTRRTTATAITATITTTDNNGQRVPKSVKQAWLGGQPSRIAMPEKHMRPTPETQKDDKQATTGLQSKQCWTRPRYVCVCAHVAEWGKKSRNDWVQYIHSLIVVQTDEVVMYKRRKMKRNILQSHEPTLKPNGSSKSDHTGQLT